MAALHVAGAQRAGGLLFQAGLQPKLFAAKRRCGGSADIPPAVARCIIMTIECVRM